MLARRDRLALQLQRWISWINSFWFTGLFCLLFQFYAKYSCPTLATVRKKTRDALDAAGDRPVLICANHLTLIDSMIINWLMFSYVDYIRNWRRMPWNMPELRNFSRNIPVRIMCYLGKCLYIERGGNVSGQRLTLEKFKQLLQWRDLICIFPEGTRSRNGRIRGSMPTYSVGEICMQLPDTQVLCIYMRGLGQETYGSLPEKRESFYMDLALIQPSHVSEGKRGAKEISLQIMEQLGQMEDQFFNTAVASST